MAVVTLNAVGMTIGNPLFQDISLTVGRADRIALVASNGGGKTTLLKCLVGEVEPTSGEIIRSRGLRIGYVEQDVPEHLLPCSFHEAVRLSLPADEQETDGWRVDMVLDEFEAPESLRRMPVASLSGGWQRLALIARAWVNQPDLLLLDEPTNHLDLARVLQLERWLVSTRDVPMVVASHDRAFLDAVTNRTLFLRPTISRLFALPYGRAREALAETDMAAQAQQERDLKEVGKLRKQAAKLTNMGINSGSDLLVQKSKYLRDRAEKIETSIRSLHKERAGEIRLVNSGSHAKVMLGLEDVDVCKPGGELLFRIGKLHLFQGDRAIVLGRNGSGKSLLIRMIHDATGSAPASAARLSPQVRLGYMDQALSQLPERKSPSDFVLAFGVGDQRCRSLLAAAGIAIEKQEAPISRLSFGQRARLALLGLRLAEPNFYLLDEPTNHVDIPGQERLEAEILDHGATALLVSHDRSFVRNVGTRFLQIERKRLVEVESPEPFFAEQERAA